MGKKRNTAKTGDKSIYASRGNRESVAQKYVDDDNMYNDVDRYNNARDDLQDDVLNFDNNDDQSEEEGLQNDVENVFDLGIGQSDEESSSDDISTSSSDEVEKHREGEETQNSDDDGISVDDDSSIEGMEEIPKADLLNWGKRKKDYYNGDTADLEIGQEIEDAELEEEAGKEILKTRLEGMTEADYLLDEEEADDDRSLEDEKKTDTARDISDTMHSSKRRKFEKLSKSEKVKIMSKNHPELLPLISHFRDEAIRPCAEETLVVLNALIQNSSNPEVRDCCIHIEIASMID